MQAGKLRHLVTLQSLGARVDDGIGGGSIPFADVAELWASIEPLSGRELLLAGQLDDRMTTRVRTRYYAGVRPSWRIRWVDNGTVHVFDIKSIADKEERHIELEMMCEELVTW